MHREMIAGGETPQMVQAVVAQGLQSGRHGNPRLQEDGDRLLPVAPFGVTAHGETITQKILKLGNDLRACLAGQDELRGLLQPALLWGRSPAENVSRKTQLLTRFARRTATAIPYGLRARLLTAAPMTNDNPAYPFQVAPEQIEEHLDSFVAATVSSLSSF
jgi:hypothetical protein